MIAGESAFLQVGEIQQGAPIANNAAWLRLRVGEAAPLLPDRLTAVLSTAGGVAFVGDFDRVFRAVDVKNGKTLWTTRLGTTLKGYPVSFAVDGKQYIAVTTGLGGGSPEAKPSTMLTEVHRPLYGQAVYVFALPDAPK